MKIAVVDNEPSMNELIADYLEDEGYEVTRAYEPDDITKPLPDFDVIIMDVMFEPDRTKGLRYVRDMAQKSLIAPEKLVIRYAVQHFIQGPYRRFP